MSYQLAVKKLKGRLIAPYQRDGVLWLLNREQASKNPGGFLCDEMGLGKTVQMISTFLGNPKKHTLIVVPKSIISQWKDELDHFAPCISVLIHDGPKRAVAPEDLKKYEVVVAPYSVLKTDDTVMHKIRWDRIVLDEGHEIRNKNSKVSKACRSLVSDIHWVVTGTPVYNSNKDFVTLCSFVGIHKSHVLGIKDKVKDTYVLRRTKEDFNDRLRLPECDFGMVELDMYPEEKSVYSAIFAKNQKKVKEMVKYAENLSMHYMNMLECLLRCRQAMIHPNMVVPDWQGRVKKLEYLIDSIMKHPNEKTLVFCQFRYEMAFVQKELESRGVSVFRLDGSIPSESRADIIKNFRKSSSHTVFIIQIKTGGQGLNLQQATRIYITAPSWNPATELQAIARSHRTGQSKKVVVRKLIYKEVSEKIPSVEESIISLQQHKSVLCSQVLNDPRIVEQLPKSKNQTKIVELRKIFNV